MLVSLCTLSYASCILDTAGLLPQSKAERSLKSVLLELLKGLLEMIPVWRGFQEFLHLSVKTR